MLHGKYCFDAYTYTCGGTHPRRIELSSSIEHAEVPIPGVGAFIDFVAQAKPVRFESAGAFALHTFPFGFNPGGATGTQGIGICSVEVCS